MRRALVSLPEGVWKIIDEQLRGEMGDTDSEIIRNIVIAFLTQQGYFASQSVNEKIETVDTIISSLAEILEEKGQLNYAELGARIRNKIAKQ